jgi:hypothetical protein
VYHSLEKIIEILRGALIMGKGQGQSSTAKYRGKNKCNNTVCRNKKSVKKSLEKYFTFEGGSNNGKRPRTV